MHGTLQGRIGRFGVHDVENPVDRFIAARSQDRGTEDQLTVGVDDDFHEASCFTFLDRTSNLRHRSRPDQQALACSLRFRFSQSGPAKGRIGKESVGGYPISDPTSDLIEQIGCDDLKVTVGCVSKCALSVAVAQRPDARRARAQVVVHNDVTTLVDLDTRRFQPKVVGIRSPAHRKKHVRSEDLRLTVAADDTNAYILTACYEANAFRIHSGLDAFGRENLPDAGRNLRVLALDEAIGHFHDRDLRPEASIDLGELESNIATTDNYEMARENL